MIFIDYSLEEWLKKYPCLDQLAIDCDCCGKALVATKPFVEKGYAGLIAPECECGNNRHTCVSKVTTSKETYEQWTSLIGNYL